ncbi:MAG: erythromycin esterase family protein [Steroidobacter sp.]|nr:erythromycin esterase family protein [Steroidobacter sp.]
MKNLAGIVPALVLAFAVLASATSGAADSPTLRVLPLQSLDLTNASDDLRDVARLVADARVVGFGEGWHYVHEFLTMRNRLFVYLVEHGGVTAYAGETGFERGVVADDFVAGRSARSSDAIGAVFYNAELAENRQLLDWIRAYNDKPSTRQPIRFYGIDVSAGRSRAPWPVAAMDYLWQRDPSLARRFERRLQVLRSPLSIDEYVALPASERGALTEAISDLIDVFDGMQLEWIRQSSRTQFERAHRAVLVARQGDVQRRCDQRLRSDETQPSLACEQLRDGAMAENLRWAMEQERSRGRVFVFAHNWHLDKVGSRPAESGGGTVHSMGVYLNEALGARYQVIASMGGGMADREYVSTDSRMLRDLEWLRRVNRPQYVLDLSVGAASETQLPASFDAMLFINKVRPCLGCDAKLAAP